MTRALLLLLGSSCAVACSLPLDAVDAEPYESCHPQTIGEPCGRGPTTCREAPVFEYSVAMCTMHCEVDDDCVVHASLPVRCEQFTEATLCVVPCQGADAGCPLGTVCREEQRINGRPVFFCAPE